MNLGVGMYLVRGRYVCGCRGVLSEVQLKLRMLDDALDGLHVLEISSTSEDSRVIASLAGFLLVASHSASQDSPVPATPATVWTPSVLLDTSDFEGVVGLAILSDARAVLFSFFCPVYH